MRAKSPSALSRAELEQLALTTFSHHGYESRKRILKVWSWDRANGKPVESVYHGDAARSRVPKLSDAELARFLLDCVLVSDLHVSAWMKNDKPERLLGAAKKLRIDAEAIRKESDSNVGSQKNLLSASAKSAKNKIASKAIGKSSHRVTQKKA